MNKEEISLEIVQKILPKHLQFVVSYTEYNEDGSFSIQLSDRAEAIYNDILKLLEENDNSK